MYGQAVYKLMHRAGSKNAKGARQWLRYYDDRSGLLVYQMKWLGKDGNWHTAQRTFSRYEVLTNPDMRHFIAISLRVMRDRLARRTS
jgi:hypothetical protein